MPCLSHSHFLKVSHPRCVVKIKVREENPILYSHKTQLNMKLSLLLYYNITTTFDMCDRASCIYVRKMYQLDANNFIMILSHKRPLHVSEFYMSIFRSSYMLFHCRMWCYAIGVEAVVLRS